MTVNYGSKRLVVGAHYGFRDWLSQRVTALLMAVYTLLLLAQITHQLHNAGQRRRHHELHREPRDGLHHGQHQRLRRRCHGLWR